MLFFLSVLRSLEPSLQLLRQEKTKWSSTSSESPFVASFSITKGGAGVKNLLIENCTLRAANNRQVKTHIYHLFHAYLCGAIPVHKINALDSNV